VSADGGADRELAAAHLERLADDLAVAVKRALPQVVANHDDRGRRARRNIGVDECPAEQPQQADDLEVVGGDDHALERVAALLGDEEVEGPRVAGDRFDRRRRLLPGEPPRGRGAGVALKRSLLRDASSFTREPLATSFK